MDYKKKAMEMHAQWAGKIEVVSRAKVENTDDLSIAYTPGVAEPCLAIKADPELQYTLTRRHNMVAVITDGSAVLGLGDIGPEAGMPVMEGKCVLFKEFGNVDAFPLCVRTKDPDEFVNAVSLIAGSFGGINLEDISAPRCFEIERKLKEKCDIPVFHDDQHGTAVVVLSGIRNALKLTGKKPEDCVVAMSGAGAAGTAICKLLLKAGFRDITMRDINGVISRNKTYRDPSLTELANITNPNLKDGTLADIVKGADIFIGVSAPNLLTKEMIQTMNKDAIIFAMANPVPEVMPEVALEAGAKVIATGRSDYPNQINNVLAFPGIFRGALDVRASDINDEMKLAAADAISGLVTEEDLANGIIIPSAFNKGVVERIAKAVADAAVRTGVARVSGK
ncbi:MAG: NADP-dependent malic enzyme [Firmicutes bacterium]|nr:NADP-dependent malic enzyme [Bacillota bacterium]